MSLIEKLKGKVYYGKVTTADLAVTNDVSVSGDIVGAKQQIDVTMPLTADVIDHIVFVANDTYKVTDVREVHATAETTSTGTALQVERLQGTEAPGAGDDLLESSATIDIKGTANTVQQGVVVSSTAINLAVGDRLGIVIDGATNEIAGSAVTIEIEKL